MKIIPRKLKGTFEITFSPNYDERGFFARIYDREIFKEYGIDREWLQENHSHSMKRHIIRGLHFQFPPFAETKLIRVVRGAVWDVFVDLRKDSPTFGQWDAIQLSDENQKMILIPRGFAHGYCTLTDVSEVLYKVDNVYNPDAEGGIVWNDPQLHIPWPARNPIVSKKDSRLGTLDDFVRQWGPINLNEKGQKKGLKEVEKYIEHSAV